MSMKIVQKEFGVGTRSRTEMVDITGQVEAAVRDAGVRDGEVVVFCPHTTAAITINENADPSVVHDMLRVFDRLFPRSDPGYRHSEGNSDAHCKSSLVGCSEHVLLKNGALTLGTWQGIYFAEFDGPRSRRVIVQVRGE
jgi:secondary thiamine-phosphate synthase enzyme